MPQLDIGTFPMQLFWLAITFITLYVMMAKVALPRVGAVLEARSRRIDGDLAAATEARTQAEAAIQTYERGLAEARAEAQAVLRQTAEDLASAAQQREQEVSARLAQEAAQAEQRIAAAKQVALGHVREIAVEAARAAAGRLIGQDLTEAEAGAAVDQVIGNR